MTTYEYKHMTVEASLEKFLEMLNNEGAQGWQISTGGLREKDDGSHHYSVILVRSTSANDNANKRIDELMAALFAAATARD